MPEPNLVLNILTFNHPHKEETSPFTISCDRFYRLHQIITCICSSFTKEAEKNEQDFFYVDFTSSAKSGMLITVDLPKRALLPKTLLHLAYSTIF